MVGANAKQNNQKWIAVRSGKCLSDHYLVVFGAKLQFFAYF